MRMYLMLHNLENSVQFIYKEFCVCQISNILYSMKRGGERLEAVIRGEEVTYNGIRFQIYLDPLLKKVSVRFGN